MILHSSATGNGQQQDDMNLILGGNAVRLYNLRTPGGLTRMFKFVD